MTRLLGFDNGRGHGIVGERARMTDPMIEFRVLGPVQAVRGGQPLRLGGRRQRALLAVLLVHAGRPLSADRLADELWGNARPDGALVTLPTYVSRLRASLGGEVVIRGSDDGYALETAPEQLDAARFEALVREADAALVRGTPMRARERLGAALDLWRGQPFGDLRADGILRVESERLEELRLRALELRNEADLAMGHAAGLVPDLEALVAEYPFRERLWSQLMLALYRSGRQADALLAYRRARGILEEQLGVDPGDELDALQQAILRHEVPAPATPEHRHNVPAPLSSFVGRQRELRELGALLDRHRLITVTGIGGVGKTRLLLEVAHEAISSRADGVRFVDFSAIDDPTLVVTSVATALGIRWQPGKTTLTELASAAGGLDLLLALDNCEHVVDAVAELATVLLTRAPRISILATSRESLGAAGEMNYALEPLAVAPAPGEDGVDAQPEAVVLFLARARSANPGVESEPGHVATAGRICAALDGLPLALELAAARAKTLSLHDIDERLTDRLGFLVSSRRVATARHRTLREAMDWSFGLLAPHERELFADLSVFAGTFSLSAATEVCLAGDDQAAVDLLGRLVDASLVTRVGLSRETRYRLLQTVRDYAAEQLARRAATLDRQARHATYFEGVALDVWVPLRREGGSWITTVAVDHDNFRTALGWLRATGLRERFLRLAEAMWWFWSVHLDLAEGRSWLASALDLAPDAEPGLRGRASLGAATLAWMTGDLDDAVHRAETAGTLFAGMSTVTSPEGPQPAGRFEAAVWELLGLISLAREDHERAEAHLWRSRDAVLGLPEENPWKRDNLGASAIVIGQVALARNDPLRAEREFADARATWGELGSPVGIALADMHLSFVDVDFGRHANAASRLAGAFATLREADHAQFVVDCLDATASIAVAAGRASDALWCLSASTRLRERAGFPAYGWLRRLRERLLAETRRALDRATFEEAWADGRAQSASATIDHAVELLERIRREPGWNAGTVGSLTTPRGAGGPPRS